MNYETVLAFVSHAEKIKLYKSDAPIQITSLNAEEYLRIILNKFGFEENVYIVLPSWFVVKISWNESSLSKKMLYEWMNGIRLFNADVKAYKQENVYGESYILINCNSKWYYVTLEYCTEP